MGPRRWKRPTPWHTELEVLMQRQYTPTIADRFWPKVNKDGPIPELCPHLGPCWLWMGSRDKNGYGRIQAGGRSLGVALAHKCAYEWECGQVPDGLELDHLCMNPGCVNPLHLEAVTHQENTRRAFKARPRKKYTHLSCPHGHEFTPENSYFKPNGARACRTCTRLRSMRRPQ